MTASVGQDVVDRTGHRLGRVDAVFADYLLVRTRGMLPVDLYLPIDECAVTDERVTAEADSAADAYERWHRPLKRAPHP